MHEKRKHERFELPLEIRVIWPGQTEHVGITINFSDGGALLKIPFDAEPQPETIVELQLTSQVMGQSAPVLRGRVVRTVTNGIAFKFISPEA
jgi:hypothetical protein